MNSILNRFKALFIILAVVLALMAGGYGAIRASVNQYNNTLRSDKTDEGLTMDTHPRGGVTDSWTKIISDETTWTGTIFELSAANTTSCEISDWSERYNILSDCYLNNGWCGTFEVHQFKDGVETVQTVDLRNYVVEDITLDYLMEGQDLMIALHAGDYIVYQPSAEVYEIPLNVSSSTTIGFILYYLGDTPDLSDTEAFFHFHMDYKQTTAFKALFVLFCVWGIAVIVVFCMFLFARSTERELEKKEKNLEESIGIFSGFVDAKDSYTNGHSKRVAEYAVKIAKEMGYSEQQCRNVYYISLMHDCGKCYIPDQVLKKPGRLTAEEYDIIKSHTTRGAELLEDFKSLENIKEGALYHHERFDGKGYPCGLSGKDIPEIGRILGIADAFDAMNSRRVYRDPLSQEEITSELTKGNGTQFDPDLLSIFLKLIEKGEIEFRKKAEV